EPLDSRVRGFDRLDPHHVAGLEVRERQRASRQIRMIRDYSLEERMAANDDRVAGGAGRDHVYGHARKLLDPTQVGLGFGRKLLVRGSAGRRLLPTGVAFVDRLAFTITVDQERRRVELAAVEL